MTKSFYDVKDDIKAIKKRQQRITLLSFFMALFKKMITHPHRHPHR